MFDVVLGCDFENAHSPVDFGFFADGEAVCVHEG